MKTSLKYNTKLTPKESFQNNGFARNDYCFMPPSSKPLYKNVTDKSNNELLCFPEHELAQSIYQRGRLSPYHKFYPPPRGQGRARHATGRPLLSPGPCQGALEGLWELSPYDWCGFIKTNTACASCPAVSFLLFSSHTSPSVFQRGQMTLDRHL